MHLQALMFAAWLAIMAGLSGDQAPSSASNSLAAIDTTLVDSVDAGRYLIVQLPERLASRRVDEYTARRIPTLSWLRGRSFFWQVPADTSGPFRFEFAGQTRDDSLHSVRLNVFVRKPGL